ncbi:SPOR domain-containing protein [Thioalbus denitrificans]|uniref:SPOR domain-containing protein n=1 Tax=Thioalbus denitrificans TaxID=547122 RepID=A0A369CA38_9GAMM|nr:SPOR domain-containing protein [Thioalbus denitrificans]RCX29985.1 hypothetical protein DFQ59_106226 [Thioalbus denitrificans]
MKWVFLLVLLGNGVLFGLGIAGKLPAPPTAAAPAVAHGLPPLVLWNETDAGKAVVSPSAAPADEPGSRGEEEGGADSGDPVPATAPAGSGPHAPADPSAGRETGGRGLADDASVVAPAAAADPGEEADTGAVPPGDGAQEPNPVAESAAAEPGGAGDVALRHCYRVGPFTDKEMARQVGSLLAQGGARVEPRTGNLPQVQAYWVLQSGFADRDAALEQVRELRGNGVDSFVITDAGHENDVSLGLFRQESAAHRHRATLAEKGIEAEVTPRERYQEVTWILVEDESAGPPELPADIAAQATIEERACP